MGKSRRDKKHNIKKGVIDEWEICDVDRDEVNAGQKRRARRWKEIKMQEQIARNLEKQAIKNAEKMKAPPVNRPPTPLEEAWLRCDYILWNIMTQQAYSFMEYQRKNDPDVYKYLYKVFMPQRVMQWAEKYVDLLANGHQFQKKVPLPDVINYYRRFKGIKNTITVKRKGQKDREL